VKLNKKNKKSLGKPEGFVKGASFSGRPNPKASFQPIARRRRGCEARSCDLSFVSKDYHIFFMHYAVFVVWN
jgi:hypothetical protein